MADIAKIRLGNQEGAYTEYDIKDATARQAAVDLDERVDEIEGNIDVKVQPSGGTFYRYGVPTTDNWCSKFVSKDIAGIVVETADEARKFNLRNPATSGICIASGAGQRWNIVAPNGYRIKTYKIVATLRDGQPEGVVFLTPQGGDPFQILPNSDITIEVSVNDASTYFLTEDVSTEPLDRQIWFKTFEVHVERTSSLATMDDVDRKQDTISDLTTIRSGAAKGATSLQPTAQTLSDAQKAQARENIGAAALSELADYAKKDGYYESMGVGTANNLRGSDVTQGTFLCRTSGGSADIASGNAYIEGVQGNEVAWNQLIVNGNFESTGGWSGITSLIDGVATVFKDGTGSTAANTAGINPNAKKVVVSGHKYYFRALLLSGNSDTKVRIRPTNSASYGYSATQVFSQWTRVGYIWTASVTAIYPNLQGLNYDGTDVEFSAQDFCMFDLTLMFGTGNEPTTVEEAEVLIAQMVGAKNYYPYDAGTLLSMKMLGIKTVGFNAFNLTTGTATQIAGNEYEIVGTYIDAYESNDATPYTFATLDFDTALVVGNYYKTSDNSKRYLCNKAVPLFDAQSAYSIGDYVLYDNSIFKAIVTHAAGDAWHGNDWEDRTTAVLTDGDGVLAVISLVTTDNKYTASKTYLHVVGGDNTTCVHLVWSGIKDGEYEPYWEEETALDVTGITGINPNTNQRETIFPNGMCGKGDWADAIYQSGGNAVAVKKAGRKVFSSSDQWKYSPGTHVFYVPTIQDAETPSALSVVRNGLHPVYIVTSAYFVGGDMPSYDKCISWGSQNIVAKDSAYTDADTFKTAMEGTALDYKLATPITYTNLQYADGTPFTLPVGYKVDDFGTEEIITPTSTAGEPTSCAPTISVRYGVNAVDTIRRLPQTYTSKEEFTEGLNDLIDDLESGDVVPALASDLLSWSQRSLTPNTESAMSDIKVRTTAGDASIATSVPAYFQKIVPTSHMFNGTNFRASGFNLLRLTSDNGVATKGNGDWWYIPVPKLTFVGYGAHGDNNGIILTASSGTNINNATVYFKPFTSGTPSSATDGTAATYTDAQGTRFYTTSAAGWLIISGITWASTCAHLAWSITTDYNKYVSPTDANDGGTIIDLTGIGVLYRVFTIADSVERIGDTSMLKTSRVGYSNSLTWTTTQDTVEQGATQTYTHTATISGMKSGGEVAVVIGTTEQVVVMSGTSISVQDTNDATAWNALTKDVYYQLAAETTSTITINTLVPVNDMGIEVLDATAGTATVTMLYAQGIQDTVAYIVSEWKPGIQDEVALLSEEIGDLTAALYDEMAKDPDMKYGQPRILWGNGTPQESIVPTNWRQFLDGGYNWIGKPAFVGQVYINTATTTGGYYVGYMANNYTLNWRTIIA